MNQRERPLADLVNTEEPGLPMVQEWAADAPHAVEFLPVEQPKADEVLRNIQVTTRSPMGAIVHGTGGILVDHGWLRILGGGSSRFTRDLASWNRITKPQQEHRLPGTVVVADDAVGGFFAINGGGLPGNPGSVFYLAPDTCEWEDTGNGYSQWLCWAFSERLAPYYESMRWPAWRTEIQTMTADEGLSIYPFLWAEGAPLQDRSREPVAIEELWHLHSVEFPRQLRSSE